jgi:hypothetical protein
LINSLKAFNIQIRRIYWQKLLPQQ